MSVEGAQNVPELTNRRYKMQLRQTEFLVNVSGNNGRFPAGAILQVDEATAYRWYESNVADIAPPDAETYGEIVHRSKREEFDRKARAVEGSVIDQMAAREAGERQLMPPPMPVPGRRRARRDLADADITYQPDDEA
jgi:hypothetical protein